MGAGTDTATASPWGRLRRRLAGEGVGAILVRGATGSAGAQAAGAVLALLAQLLLARLLGVSQYGYYVYAFTWMMILAQLCRLGFQNGLVRFIAAYRTEANWPALKGVATRATQLVLATAVVAAGLMALVPLLFEQYLSADQVDTFLWAAVALVPLALLGVTQGILQGYRKPARALLPFRTLLHGGILVLALALAPSVGLDSATVAMALTAAAAIGSLLVAAHWTRAAIAPDTGGVAAEFHTGYWTRASLPLLLMVGMQMIMKQVDTVMLGSIIGTDASGLYFPLARMSELAAFGLISANAIVAPMISELHTAGQRERLQRLLTLTSIGTSFVTLVAVLGFWLLGPWILSLFGPEFVSGYPALMVLLGGQVVNALCGPVGFLMTMTGHQNRASIVLIGGALVNVALNAILIPQYGVMGAATATSISIAFWNLWMLWEVARRHRLNTSVFARWPSLRF